MPETKNYNRYQRCVKNFDIYSIWIPVLSVRLDDGTVKTANGWENFINEDKDEIIEYPSDEKYNKKLDTYNAPAGCCPPKWGSRKRVVFMKMKDDFGNSCCRFLGVFKSDHIEYEKGKQKRVYKRIAKTITFNEIVKKS